MPRVVSGVAGSIILEAPEGMKTRPTSDKVKEAVFNILGEKVFGCSFLDLYSGSGQIGIEALSRGAKRAVFVENSAICVKIILKNLKKTHLEDNSRVLNMKVLTGIKTLKGDKGFDIIYLDPPYLNAIKDFKEIVLSVSDNGLLNKGALVILEHSSKDSPEEFVINLKLKRSCKYGSVMVSFYENNENRLNM